MQIDLTCTKCGSNLSVVSEEGMTTAVCQYCGQKILLDKETLEVNVHHDGHITEEKSESDKLLTIVIAVLLILGGCALVCLLL